jgi:hypothetical protein
MGLFDAFTGKKSQKKAKKAFIEQKAEESAARYQADVSTVQDTNQNLAEMNQRRRTGRLGVAAFAYGAPSVGTYASGTPTQSMYAYQGPGGTSNTVVGSAINGLIGSYYGSPSKSGTMPVPSIGSIRF